MKFFGLILLLLLFRLNGFGQYAPMFTAYSQRIYIIAEEDLGNNLRFFSTYGVRHDLEANVANAYSLIRNIKSDSNGENYVNIKLYKLDRAGFRMDDRLMEFDIYFSNVPDTIYYLLRIKKFNSSYRKIMVSVSHGKKVGKLKTKRMIINENFCDITDAVFSKDN